MKTAASPIRTLFATPSSNSNHVVLPFSGNMVICASIGSYEYTHKVIGTLYIPSPGTALMTLGIALSGVTSFGFLPNLTCLI